jgi:hypothetical protein
MKPSFLKIFQEVNTEHGRGILVGIETPHNGLCVDFDKSKATVWYGAKNVVVGGGSWISRVYLLRDLEEWNSELKLDNILNDLGI